MEKDDSLLLYGSKTGRCKGRRGKFNVTKVNAVKGKSRILDYWKSMRKENCTTPKEGSVTG